MNIFYFSSDPAECARHHCDKHVVKMCIEYAQLLSTAHRVLDGQEIVMLKNNRKRKAFILEHDDFNDYLYKATHINHPSAKWVRNSYENYSWLLNMWIYLCQEYTKRYGKIHLSSALTTFLLNSPKNIDIQKPFEPPWRAMPIQYKINKSDPAYCQKSYHLYFYKEKQHIAQWKHNEIPEWFIQEK